MSACRGRHGRRSDGEGRVTGAAGIGTEVVRLFLRSGAAVLATDVDAMPAVAGRRTRRERPTGVRGR
jgi:NAD(P)-dependent dehydrogenase (short-subunit alcohol dehydrogenase family)